jgi:hypothetical protein
LFTVGLDFGPVAFAGDERWLGIRIKCSGDGDYVSLGRQELAAAPCAHYALGAPWSGLDGVPAGFADGVDNMSVVVSGTNILAGEGLDQFRHIRGSESRSSDFDRDFNPLHDHNRRRWLNVAAARQRGKALPLVKLIQVGDVYFVRDGHHRISVARALGQRSISPAPASRHPRFVSLTSPFRI